DGNVVPSQAVPPFSFVATDAATSSPRTPIGHSKDELDGVDQSLPTGSFCFELLPAFACQAIELRLPSSLGLLPIRRQEVAVFKPVQSRVKRPLRDLGHTARYLLQSLRNCVSVDRAKRDNLQEQEIQRALGEIRFWRRHGLYLDLLYIP